jgi:hypothetical protein
MTSASFVSPQIDHDGVISSITVKGLSKTAALTLDHALVHVWREAQLARSCEEHEDFNIALKLLGLLRDGSSSGDLFNLACGYAVGLCHARYLRRSAERAESMRLEFLQAIPDYDWSREPRIPDRDPTDGRRHFGNQYASHGMDTPAIKEAAAKLGISKFAIYHRLRRGWTWAQASSETRISGRRINSIDGTISRRSFPTQRQPVDTQIANSPTPNTVAEILLPIGDKPRNERQARELVGLAPEQIKQIANNPTVNTKDPYTLELRLLRIEQLREAGRSSWSESVRAKRKQHLTESLAENVGKRLLDNVSDYLYGESQGARNAFERDSYTLALGLLAAVRRGDPDPLVSASYASFGGSFPRYVQHRADGQWLAHQELIRSLPQEEKHGHKLLIMASSRVSRTDARATGEANPPAPPARERLGDRATANRRKLATVIEWPESPGVGDIASR